MNQNSYDYWKQHVYDESVLCSDKETINAAILLLIDRIKNSDQNLKDMPTDHRIFEELIAEVFDGFGYTIELAKNPYVFTEQGVYMLMTVLNSLQLMV